MINETDSRQQIIDAIQGKEVLYIATKNRDYLRIEQEISLIKEHAKNIDLIVSSKDSYVLRLLYVYLKTLFHIKNHDVIFIGFAPQLILPFFLWRFKNKIVIIDFFISLYDTMVFDRKRVDKHSIIAGILRKLDTATIAASDLVICDTNEHAKYFISNLGSRPERTAVLYLNADKKYYYPKNIAKPDKLKNKFIVLYFGSALPLQGIEVIIESIKMINCDAIHFIMIGPLDKSLRPEESNNITFIDWLPQKDLSTFIAFSDLCLAGHFNNNIEKAKRVIPGKAYIYEAMCKYMILGDNTANRERYPSHYKNVLFVQMGDPEDLSKTILKEYRKKQHDT